MGSLMVEDVATNPRAIGLLFAGSSTDAIANPIKSSAELPRRDHGRPVGARRFAIQVPVRRQANGHFFAFPLPVSKLQFGNGPRIISSGGGCGCIWGTDYWSCLGGTRASGLCAQRVCNPLRQLIDTLTLAEDSGVQLRWAHRQKCLCS